jgi:hypothetical protein
MKIKTLLLAAALAGGWSLDAAPLSVTTAVQSQPDPASPVIAVLAAGTEQPKPSEQVSTTPGWMAVDIAGPFVGYVKNKDLSKALDVVPGATVYVGPKVESGVLTVFAKGDKADITGLHGSWTQVRLDKVLVGYIATSPIPAAAPAAPAQAPVMPVANVASVPAAASAPLAPAQGDRPSAALARIFEGKLTSTESPFYPRRPFKWQLSDESGNRIAYLNLEAILMTDQIDNYAGHMVVVLGSLRPVKETRDLVIDVEAFHLK